MTTFSEYRRRIAAGEPVSPLDNSVPKDARPYQGHRAGFFSRAIAAVLDLLIVVVIVLAANLGFAFLRIVLDRAQSFDFPGFGWSFGLGAFLLWLGWTYGWATTGRSIGMHVMGLRLVNYAGDNVRWAGSALRALFCVGFPIGLLWVIISPANRSVQDVVLRTSVMYDWVVSLPTVPPLPPGETA